jgi:hypothetical protein
MFLSHVAPRNIRGYVPQGTEEHNRAYVPRGTLRNISLMFLGAEHRGG